MIEKRLPYPGIVVVSRVNLMEIPKGSTDIYDQNIFRGLLSQ